MTYQEQEHLAKTQRRPTTTEQLLACPKEDEEKVFFLAESVIFETARKRKFGAKSMDRDFLTSQSKRSYLSIRFEPEETNLFVYANFEFDLTAKQFHLWADGHHFYNARAYTEVEVLNFSPDLMPSALEQMLVSIRTNILTEPYLRQAVVSSALQPIEEPFFPTYCLITDDRRWLERAKQVISPRYSPKEIVVLGPDEGVEDRLSALPEDPKVICLACDNDIYWRLFSRIADQYPASSKLAFLPRHEYTSSRVRSLVGSRRSGDLGFSDLLPVDPQNAKEEANFTKVLLEAPDWAVISWKDWLKRRSIFKNI